MIWGFLIWCKPFLAMFWCSRRLIHPDSWFASEKQIEQNWALAIGQSPWISTIKINYFSPWCPSLGRSNQSSEGHGSQGQAVLRLQAVLNPKSRPQVKLWVICTKNPKRFQAPAFSQVEVLAMLDGSAWNESIWFLKSICKMENCDSGEAKTFETISLRWMWNLPPMPCIWIFGPTDPYISSDIIWLYVSISVIHPYPIGSMVLVYILT